MEVLSLRQLLRVRARLRTHSLRIASVPSLSHSGSILCPLYCHLDCFLPHLDSKISFLLAVGGEGRTVS